MARRRTTTTMMKMRMTRTGEGPQDLALSHAGQDGNVALPEGTVDRFAAVTVHLLPALPLPDVSPRVTL